MRHSEEPLNRPQGGALGIAAASDLSLWPEVLDTLGAKLQATSRTSPKRLGAFMCFFGESPPECTVVAAQGRIAIGHADAPWLRFLERQDERPTPLAEARFRGRLRARCPSRSRAACVARAFRRPGPRALGPLGCGPGWRRGSLVESRAGPGIAHSQRSGGSPRGGLSDPSIRSRAGRCGSALRRLLDCRLRWALSEIQRRSDAARRGASSKASVERFAQGVLAVLKREPGRFAEFEGEYGEGLQRRTRGAWPTRREGAPAKTKVGELADGLIDADWAFLVAKRMDPEAIPLRPTPLTELPVPDIVAAEHYLPLLSDSDREDLMGRVVRACDFGTQPPTPQVTVSRRP